MAEPLTRDDIQSLIKESEQRIIKRIERGQRESDSKLGKRFDQIGSKVDDVSAPLECLIYTVWIGVLFAGLIPLWFMVHGVEALKTSLKANTPFMFHSTIDALFDWVAPENVEESGSVSSEEAIALKDLSIERQAFLMAIGEAEGADYNVIYSGKTFTDFSDHPRDCIPINVPGYEGQCSDAAGRYQMISTTWEPIAQELGLTDFSPESQDRAAIALIDREDPSIWKDVDSGNLESAFCKAGASWGWASLPCSTAGQGGKSEDQMMAIYEGHLKELQTAKPANLSVELGEDGSLEVSDSAPLKSGDMIGSFRVTRGIIDGVHEGVDLATPIGTPLFIPGSKGESVVVECSEQTEGDTATLGGWGIYGKFYVRSLDKSFLVAHLGECNPGEYKQGEVWGFTASTGRSTGPHSHTEQCTGDTAGILCKIEEPSRKYIEQIHGVF